MGILNMGAELGNQLMVIFKLIIILEARKILLFF